MSQAAKVQEPSMEEILASIRRIISDEETPPKPSASKPEPVAMAAAPAPAKPAIVPTSPRPAPAAAAPAPRTPDIGKEFDAIFDEAVANVNAQPAPEPDILDLTEDMAIEAEEEAIEAPRAAEPPVFRTIDAQSDVVFAEEDASEEAAFDLEPAAEPVAAAPAYPRVAHPGNGAAPGQTLLSASTSASVDSAFHSLAQAVMVQNGRTLEDIVCDMMRPMLKSWLDDNLPGLVERLVRAEIERVSRGRP